MITINKIKHFSAKVKSLPHDPSAPTRQDIYWRALKTIPNLEIIPGNFVSWPKLLPQHPLAYVNNDLRHPPQKVQVERAEEKGSDVNLAVFLVYDNCIAQANESIVISNDSDLSNAITIVTRNLKRPVTIVNPNRSDMVRSNPRRCSLQQTLKSASTNFVASINASVLSKALFPPTMKDSKGTFTKPPAW
jgi:hypothetical protein